MGADRLESLHSVVDAYQKRVRSGAIQHDPVQASVAAKLDEVVREIVSKRLAAKKSALGWLFAKQVHKIEGLYIYGGVGRGKTMLMDLFYERVPVTRKRRIHFNDFMAEIQDRISDHRKAVKKGLAKSDDPIPPVAKIVASEARVLCFDEFQVTDIADAMILSRLFTSLFHEGIILVATSNVAPRDLYRDGLNRSLFLPFVDVLEAHAEIVPLDTGKDYRLENLNRLPVYISPLGSMASSRFDEAWNAAISGRSEKSETLSVKGRKLNIGRAAGNAVRFDFEEICGSPMGARDYIALADRFDLFFVENVPEMGRETRNEAKRFILLIDTLYDKGRKLVISAANEPDRLYRDSSGTEAFEFARTASRLNEMQSQDWQQNMIEASK